MNQYLFHLSSVVQNTPYRSEDPSPQATENSTRHQDKFGLLPTIWVHQLKGKVPLDFPSRPSGYARLPIYKLCNLDKDLNKVPDKKAIKKWIEGEVLMHSLRECVPRIRDAQG